MCPRWRCPKKYGSSSIHANFFFQERDFSILVCLASRQECRAVTKCTSSTRELFIHDNFAYKYFFIFLIVTIYLLGSLYVDKRKFALFHYVQETKFINRDPYGSTRRNYYRIFSRYNLSLFHIQEILFLKGSAQKIYLQFYDIWIFSKILYYTPLIKFFILL